MCGRTACALAPDQICRAARHKTKNGKWAQPRWRDPPGGQKYYTSHNIAPTSHTPVMISKKHVDDHECVSTSFDVESESEPSDYVIQPMYWGLVPNWHKGEAKAIAYKMNNARSDGMLQKRSFKGPLEKGRRCVVLVEGYYEWHTHDNGKKQPYFISRVPKEDTTVLGKQEIKQELSDFASDSNANIKEEIKCELPASTTELKQEIKEEPICDEASIASKDDHSDRKQNTVKNEMKGETDDHKQSSVDWHFTEAEDPPRRLLAMAGLFDVWDSKNGDGPLYSYSIITVDAHKSLSFIHHRMPAILNGEEEIQAWLNYDSVPLGKAVELIYAKDCVHFYPVSTMVNKVQNKSEECIKPVDLSKPKTSKSSLFMTGWLAKGKSPSPEKRPVTEKSTVQKAEKSPKKPNMMAAWLSKASSPRKDEKENGEPPNKKLKSGNN